MYIAYPLLLTWLAVSRDARLWRALIVPAFVFIVVSVLRKFLNFPRPYEKLAITPLIDREGSGQSFPSRHASSAAVIAAAFWYIWPAAGAVLSVIALLIAVVRPLAGLHYPRDTFAGIVFSLAAALPGYWLIG
jgi:membrane-associated phospholipid phosphatase